MNNIVKEKKIFEIEFLRTISILLVILFHFDLLNFNGGFVSVDVLINKNVKIFKNYIKTKFNH